MTQYQNQFDRVERYYARFKEINDGREHNAHSESYFDDIYAFFMHCYHLKNFLKNDSAYTKYNNSEIENHITNTFSLSLCADICNGLKHLSLNNTRSGATPNASNGTINLNISENMFGGEEAKITISVSVVIKHVVMSMMLLMLLLRQWMRGETLYNYA